MNTAPAAQSASEARDTIAKARHAHRHHDYEAVETMCRDLLERRPGTPEALLLLGMALMLQGHGSEGMEHIEAVLGPPDTSPAADTPRPPSYPSKGPETSDWYADTGLAHMLRGETAHALAALERALELPHPAAAAFTRIGALHLAAGRMEDAGQAFTEAANREPKRAEHHVNLGAIASRAGRYQEALNHYNRAVFLNPDLPQARTGRSSLLVALERANEAVFELEARIEASCREPDSDDCVNNRIHLAHVLEGAARWDDAVGVLRQGLRAAPESIPLLSALCSFMQLRQRFALALALAQKGLELDADNIGFLLAAARSACEAGALQDALDHADKALRIAPEMPACKLARTQVLTESDRTEEAESELRAMLETLPGLYEGWSQLGQLLLQNGRTDEAAEAMERAAELNPTALAALVDAKRFPDDPAAMESLRRLADNPLAHRDVRASINFALARLHEQKGEYAAAFERADKANEQARLSTDFDMNEFEWTAERIMALYTPELFAQHRHMGSASRRPVFVVGMPRSGTTLTEQILSSHPEVFGAGELGYIPAITRLMPRVLKTHLAYPECLPLFPKELTRHASAYYLRKIEALNNTALRVVDKLPFNFLHVGLIRLAFPNAYIISVQREPLDTAVSNYFTNFKHRHGLGYANDLDQLARMLRLHRRMMEHWHRVLDVPMFELAYEDILDDPEGSSRALLDFIGLEWDEQVLEFHKNRRPVKTASVWQVRQPLYSSSRGRWHHYETQLAPLREALARPEEHSA